MRGRRHLPVVWLSAALGLVCATSASLAFVDEPRAPTAIRHLQAETVAVAGRSRIIHFAVAAAPESDLAPNVSVADPTILEVVRPPSVLAGESTGTVRVRGLTSGATTLTIGGAPLRIRVTESRSGASSDRFAPRIVGPASGAAVWGRVAVGVEMRMRPGRPLRHVAVYAGDWISLMPREDTKATCQPYRQLWYTLDTQQMAPGPLDLQAVATDEHGVEQGGEVVRVQVVDVGSDRLTAGEAEWPYEVGVERRFGGGQLTIATDDDASGGRYVDNANPFPAVAFPVVVLQPGWYQMMVTARGTRAQGALPLIGVLHEQSGEPLTNGRLVAETWHRLAVGIPFRLEPGRHVLTPYFANDFSVAGVADRNLHLDRIEVARVGFVDPSAGADAADATRTELDPYGLASPTLRIAFTRPLHGVTASGLLEIEGRVWRADADRVPPPLVTAFVNDAPVATQRTWAPRFRIDAPHFPEEINRVRLVARSNDGPAAVTPVQHVRGAPAPRDRETAEQEVRDATEQDDRGTAEQDDRGTAALNVRRAPSRAPARARRMLRYTVHDERWQPGIERLFRALHQPAERRAAAFSTRRAVAIELPEDLAGTFDVLLEARGERADDLPTVSLSLSNRDGMSELGRMVVAEGWNTARIATIDLPAGRTRLIVRLEDESDDDAPRLLLQALILAERPFTVDETAPTVSLDYPPDDHPAFRVDAVVGVATDEAGLRRVELLVDGEPTGQAIGLEPVSGRFVFPLLLRGLEPGPHAVSVRATDAAGNAAVSESHTVYVRADAPDVPGRYHRAVRLLNRFAYGPDPRALADVLTADDEIAWLDAALRAPLDEPGDLAALGCAVTEHPGLGTADVAGRVLAHLLRTPNPARARFVLWVENHFSTWIRKTGSETKWAEHVAFSRLGPARFDELLFASAESPAMLAYLDQTGSYAGRLNENYAREIMELHTLGVDGGYAQSDVTSLAHVLTGWTTSLDGDGRSAGSGARRYTFRFAPRLNDGDGARVFGVDLPEADAGARFDRAVMAIEHLAAHPSTARFISRKLAEQYVAAPAPDALVDELTSLFLESGGDLPAMVSALAGAADLTGRAAPERIAQPVDYVVRLLRTTGHPDAARAGAFLRASGQGLFDRSTPDGYPEEGAAYVDTNALLQRWKLALDTTEPLAALVPAAWRSGDEPADEAWAQQVVDIVAVRLTGALLSEASNRAAVGLLAEVRGTRADRVRVIAPFIAQLPEASIR